MSIAIMLSGSISKQPETRTSAKGNSYAVATIRTGEGDDAVFASITAFGDLAGTLPAWKEAAPSPWSAPARSAPMRPKMAAAPEQAVVF